MLFAIANKEQLEEIQEALKKATERGWYRRLKIIQLSAQGYTVPYLKTLFELSKSTMREYIQRYNTKGLEGLKPKKQGGRPPQIGLSKEELEEVVKTNPSQFEKLKTGALNWNQALMQQYLALYQDIKVSQGTISNTFKRLGISWKRATKRLTSPDPLYIVKRRRIEQLKDKAINKTLAIQDASKPIDSSVTKTAKLVFCDSTDLHLCPQTGPAYQSKGQQVKVDSPGYQNPWYGLFGSMVYPSGEGCYTIHHGKDHRCFQAHLQHLLDLEPDTFWFVVLDNATAHTTSALDEFLALNRDRLELVFLPTYSPHLNLIERLWKFMRSQVLNNQFFPDLDALAQAVVLWFQNLDFQQFSSLMGISFT